MVFSSSGHIKTFAPNLSDMLVAAEVAARHGWNVEWEIFFILLFCEGLPHVWDLYVTAKSCEAASYFHITRNCFCLLILWHFSVVFLCSGQLFLSQASWMTDAVSMETSRQRVGLCVHMLLLAVGGFWFSRIGTFFILPSFMSGLSLTFLLRTQQRKKIPVITNC